MGRYYKKRVRPSRVVTRAGGGYGSEVIPDPGSFDLYVDINTGSDANPGTQAAPIQTIAHAGTLIEAYSAGVTRTVLVKSGTYPYSSGASSWGSIALGAGTTVNVSFEEGCIFQGPNDDVTSASWIDCAGAGVYELNFFGLGAPKGASAPRITGFDGGTGNGIGCNMSGGASFNVDNFQIDDCVDGWSMHGVNSNMSVSNLVITGCSKGALTHIHTGGLAEAVDCDFTGGTAASLGIGKPGGDAGAPQAEYTGCRFIPISAAQIFNMARTNFTDCEIGTLTVRSAVTALVTVANVTNCFCNISFDVNNFFVFNTCWGKITTRHRNAGNVSMSHCIWGTSASGTTTAFVFSDFDPGAGSPYTVTDTVIRGYAQAGGAIGTGMTATLAAQFIAGPADYDFVYMFANTLDFDADVLADAGFAAAFTNITQGVDPQIGSMATTAKADWALLPGSPCIGTGSAGSNIGFV